MTLTQKQARAIKLKQNADRLFGSGNPLSAWYLYSEAIKCNGGTAVLHCGLSACCLSLDLYHKAVQEARKAIGYDAQNVRAWINLALSQAALKQADGFTSWQRSLDVIDRKPNASSAELRRVCENGQTSFQKAKELSKSLLEDDADVEKILETPNYTPQLCSTAMKLELYERNEDYLSSAFVISSAHQDFSEGLNTAKLLRKGLQGGGHDWTLVGDGLVYLTEGLLKDRRVFDMKDSDDIFLVKEQIQWQMNAVDVAGWVERGPSHVTADAPKRLKASGWDMTRRSLATTVRTWIMRAFLAGAIDNQPDTKVELLSQAMHVLDWGCAIWNNVAAKDRGMMFEKTFINVVAAMRLEGLIESWRHKSQNDGAKATLTNAWNRLLQDPDELISNIEATPPATGDRTFTLSFYTYPLALAYYTKSFVYGEMAISQDQDSESHLLFAKYAAKNYIHAANLYPEDDEMHAWALYCALHFLWAVDSPLDRTLPIAERVRTSVPCMKRIWANSSMAADLGRDEALGQIVHFEEVARHGLESGKYKMDTCLTLDAIKNK